ncbi:hypothetical protein C8Q75DRAFT_762347 [Abortiporus biennis]|nr:hypothetical protein C8Q75DRAFT_762347 [Abortiporus biennis]
MFKRFNSSVWLCIQFGMSLIVPHVTYIQSELAEDENFDLYQLDVKTIRKNQKISQIEENLDSLSKPSLLQQADMLDPHDHIPSDIEVGSTLPSLLVVFPCRSTKFIPIEHHSLTVLSGCRTTFRSICPYHRSSVLLRAIIEKVLLRLPQSCFISFEILAAWSRDFIVLPV